MLLYGIGCEFCVVVFVEGDKVKEVEEVGVDVVGIVDFGK